jgi:hypothetical protein
MYKVKKEELQEKLLDIKQKQYEQLRKELMEAGRDVDMKVQLNSLSSLLQLARVLDEVEPLPKDLDLEHVQKEWWNVVFHRDVAAGLHQAADEDTIGVDHFVSLQMMARHKDFPVREGSTWSVYQEEEEEEG